MAGSAGGMRFSLRWKIVAATTFSVVVAAVLLVAIFTQRMGRALDDELSRRGRAVSLEMASNLAFAVFSEDKVSLDEAVKATLKDNGDAAYVVVLDGKGQVLAQATSPEARGLEVADVLEPGLVEAARTRQRAVKGLEVVEVAAPVSFAERARPEEPGLDLLNPVAPEPAKPGPKGAAPAQSKRIGQVLLGLLREPMRQQVAQVRNEALSLALLLLLISLVVVFILARLISVPLERLSQVAGAIARGDIRQEVAVPQSRDEIADLAASFAQMASALRALVQDLRGATTDLDRQSAEVLATATAQATRANEQSAALSQTSTTVKEIAQTSTQASEHAEQVIQVTTRSEEVSREGQKAVGQSVAGMEQLGEQVTAIAATITDLSERTLQIGDIISTVKEVAEQSNLLALNASIEAAKAGEHGRGFAVVAMEMRSLAEQSKLAAGQVRTILGEVHKGIRAAVAATEEGSKRAQATITLSKASGETIQDLAEVSRESAQAAKQIAANTRQQAIGVEQIVTAIGELSGAMNDSVAGTQKIERVAGELKTLSGRLNDLVGRFQA